MRFLMRSLMGLMLLTVTLGLLGVSVATILEAGRVREASQSARRPAAERVFAVNVDVLQPQDVRPVLTAYGDLQSAVQLELRAATGGTLQELAADFRDGGRVSAGEVLFRVDPAAYETDLALAESDLDAARAEEQEAAIGLDLAREEMAAAERQVELRRAALARSEDLRTRGVGTAADLEAAQLALASAEQALTGRRLAIAQAEARINRAGIATARAQIARDEAARDLANTVEVAPFSGVLTDVDGVLGRLVSVNEKLGLLIDPNALEVAFRISNAEFARLADGDGDILPLEVVAGLEVDGIELSVTGVLDRAGGAVGSGQSGRLVYARLDAGQPGLLRPGAFMQVRVTEPSLRNVAVVPSTAVNAAGALLLLGGEDRLEEVQVAVLRRQGDQVIVGEVPFGRTYVTERLPQLGPGVRVRPVGPEGAAAPEPMVALSAERRAVLVAQVSGNARMPEAVKQRILTALEADEVPQQMLDRLESGSQGG